MKNQILVALFLFQTTLAFGQFEPLAPVSTSPTIEEIERKKAELEAQFKVAEAGPSEDGNDQFLVLAIPPAMALTAEVLTLAVTLGLVSIQIYENLSKQYREIKFNWDNDKASAGQTLDGLKAVYYRTQNEEEKARRLKERGYSESDIEKFLVHISLKEQQCKRQENNNRPENFCDQLKEFFGIKKYRIEKTGRAYKVFKGSKLQCCLEWDNVHCGFEIFNKRGVHQGEVGCFEDEEDPCKANLSRGSHAQPQPHNHRPSASGCM